MREERLAEEKIKKKAAAKKMEEAEARRRQDEEARKQKALLQVCAGAHPVVLCAVRMSAVCCGLCEQGIRPEVLTTQMSKN